MSEVFALMVAYVLFEGLMGQKIRKNREEKKLDSVKDSPEEYQLMKEKFEYRKKRMDKIAIYLIIATLGLVLIMNSQS